jgi:hypothetical protein
MVKIVRVRKSSDHFYLTYGLAAAEIEALRKEAQEWKRMRAALRSPNVKAGRSVFEKVITVSLVVSR